MESLDGLDVPTLQQMIKDAPSYEERSRLRKALHRAQLRGAGAASTTGRSRLGAGSGLGSSAQSQSHARSSPSPTGRAPFSTSMSRPRVGRLGDGKQHSEQLTRSPRSSDSQLQRTAAKGERDEPRAETVVNQKAKRDRYASTDSTSAASVFEVQSPAAAEEDHRQPMDEEKPVSVQHGEEEDRLKQENEGGRPADGAPVASKGVEPRPHQPEESQPVEPEASSSGSVVDTQRERQSRPVDDKADDDDENTREAVERKLQQTHNYGERRRLRNKLRQLEKEETSPGNIRYRKDYSSEQNTGQAESKDDQTRVSDVLVSSKRVREDSTTAYQTKSRNSSKGDPEVTQDSEEVTTTAASTGKPAKPEEDDDGEYDDEDDEEYDEEEEDEELEKALRKPSSWQPKTHSQVDSSVQDILAQDEGLSDFRSVLKKATTATRTGGSQPQRAEQVDFRTVLHKTDELPAKNYVDHGPRQEDFRGQLKRNVQMKDCSSAAPRRTGGPRQEDFRGLLRKPGEREAPHSPDKDQRSSASETMLAEAVTADQPDSSFEAHKEKNSQPTSHPPPVKTKPKGSRRLRARSGSPPEGIGGGDMVDGNGEIDEIERVLTGAA